MLEKANYTYKYAVIWRARQPTHLPVICSIPVSYTHLDVYKRQAYQACENAGYSIASLDNSDTGVFIGNSASEYYRLTNTGDALLITGNSSPFICGRLSYWLNLKGPSMMINTACSSSLVALHTACASIREGACSMALVGGVSLFLIPESQNGVWETIGITSCDKRCKPFDASANGIVKGEGCGVAVSYTHLDVYKRQAGLTAMWF